MIVFKLERNIPDYFIDALHKSYEKIIDNLKEKKCWPEQIEAIIITDNIDLEIEKYATAWGLNFKPISKNREYSGVSKILSNYSKTSPKSIILVDFKIHLNDQINHANIVTSQILSIFLKQFLPLEFKEIDNIYNIANLTNIVKYYFIDWFTTCHSNKILLVSEVDISNKVSPQNAVINFKRNLKETLYKFNSDYEIEQNKFADLWKNYFENFNNLIIRCLENNNGQHIDFLDEILIEIESQSENIIDNRTFEIDVLKKLVINISEKFHIQITETGLHYFKNPKEYFKDDLIETEPRIVCFIDILGFSDFIDKYDKDTTSDLLQEISNILKFALDSTFNSSFRKSLTDNYIQYQTFSDNVCISIPYFDNEIDFTNNLSLLFNYIRTIQNILMEKGFFIRGGISIGNFYSDKNIIFSKALVDAYKLESKVAIYPRVVIDNKIISKLNNYKMERLNYLNFDKIIISDWENISFVNPFGLFEESFDFIKKFEEKPNNENPFPGEVEFKELMKETLSLIKPKVVKSVKENGVEQIKFHVSQNIENIEHNQSIQSKYIWLMEFIKWYEGEKSKLEFNYYNNINN